MRNYLRISFLAILLLSVNGAAFCQVETIQVTTYYPAPVGIYRQLETRNAGELVQIGNDANNAAIELRDTDGDGLTPYVDFSNDGASDFDFRYILTGNDQFWIQGGTVTFAQDNGRPATIRVGEFIICDPTAAFP